MTEIKVYALQTRVELLESGVKAIITGIKIRMNGIMYEVAYFSGDERKTVWMYEIEITPIVKLEIKIGFKP